MVKRVFLLLSLFAVVGCEWLVPLGDLQGGPTPDGGDVVDGPPGSCGADLTRAPLNCGVCGHSCLAGDCLKGRCQPASIAQNQSGPMGIAVSSDYVYWVNQTRPGLWRANKDGTAARALDSAADLIQDPFDIAVDDKFVYWTEVKANTVYYKPLGGGSKVSYGPGPIEAAFMAIEGSSVFVADYRPGTGSIVTDQLLFSEQDAVAGLAVNAGVLYWARQAARTIMTGPATGGTSATVLAQAKGRVVGVAADAGAVYWIEDGLRVKRALLQGGAPPISLYEAAQAFGDSDVAVDDTAVYWTEHDTGLVRRLAK